MTEFEQIYRKYWSLVYGYLLRLCRDPHTAEEIAQETFLSALKGIGKFRGESKMETWLCKIAEKTYYSSLRKRKDLAELSEELPDPASFENKLMDSETAFQVHQVLHKLSEPYREVFWLRVFGELSFAKIAVLFGKTESWARVTYHRAKMKIEEELP